MFTRYSDKYCGSYYITSVTPTKLLENIKFWKKRQSFQWRKDFGLFLVLSSMTNLREHFISVHKVFWQILWKSKDHFCNTQEVFWKHKFLKKGNLSSEKKILAFFFSYNRVIEQEKSQRTLCKSPKGKLSFTAEVIRSNFKKSKRLLKTNFWKKRQTFQWKKDFGLFFSYNRVWQTSRDIL